MLVTGFVAFVSGTRGLRRCSIFKTYSVLLSRIERSSSPPSTRATSTSLSMVLALAATEPDVRGVKIPWFIMYWFGVPSASHKLSLAVWSPAELPCLRASTAMPTSISTRASLRASDLPSSCTCPVDNARVCVQLDAQNVLTVVVARGAGRRERRGSVAHVCTCVHTLQHLSVTLASTAAAFMAASSFSSSSCISTAKARDCSCSDLSSPSNFLLFDISASRTCAWTLACSCTCTLAWARSRASTCASA